MTAATVPAAARRGPLVSPPPHQPWVEVAGAAFRWRLGVRPLDVGRHDPGADPGGDGPGEWFEFGDDADGPDGWIAQKAGVLDEHAATAVDLGDEAVAGGTGAECREVAASIVAHLVAIGRLDPAAAPRILDGALPPLVAVARLVPDDLVVMVERDGRRLVGAGVVCFPNRWDLHAKIGTSLAATHAPVAQLNTQLASPIERFFDRLAPERSYWRLGWGVIDHPRGYAPLDGTGVAGPGAAVTAADVHIRVERESLVRMPITRAVLFTIRTSLTAWTDLLADAPDSAASLAAAVASMPADIRRYKGISDQIATIITTG